jgi:uroporphyrinogen decarboxylase
MTTTKKICVNQINLRHLRAKIIMSTPDYNNFLKVLRREPVERPVLFEFYMDWEVVFEVLGNKKVDQDNPPYGWVKNQIQAYTDLGYDCFCMGFPTFQFGSGHKHKTETISQNGGGAIVDEETFERYQWPDPDAVDVKGFLDMVQARCPEGMKMVMGGRGPMEVAVELVGFDRLCHMTFDNPGLVKKICREIGTRVDRLFQRAVTHPVVCAGVVTDDWGYKTSTFFAPDVMREFFFPWHKNAVQTLHNAGKPAILHSCGQVEEVMDDVIDDMKYDAKHSFEDVILPVEEAYERWGNRIAILGGFDVQYLSTAKPGEVYRRATAILDQTQQRGGYALGSGNSITKYLPMDNYRALLRAVAVRIQK